MAPLVSIPTRARPIATTDGANAGANRPLRAKASQIRHARPTERIVPSALRIPEFRMTNPSYAYDCPLTLLSPPRRRRRERRRPRRDASITRREEGADRSVHGLVREDRRRPRTQ